MTMVSDSGKESLLDSLVPQDNGELEVYLSRYYIHGAGLRSSTIQQSRTVGDPTPCYSGSSSNVFSITPNSLLGLCLLHQLLSLLCLPCFSVQAPDNLFLVAAGPSLQGRSFLLLSPLPWQNSEDEIRGMCLDIRLRAC